MMLLFVEFVISTSLASLTGGLAASSGTVAKLSCSAFAIVSRPQVEVT